MRSTRIRSFRLCALVATSVLFMSCGTSHPSVPASDREPSTASGWAPPPLPASYQGISSCGEPYLVQTESTTWTLGTCAGMLSSHIGKPLVLTTGTVFYIRVMHEMSGQLVFPVPDSGNKAVVLTGRRGYIIQYRATSPGTAYLVARKTMFCEGIDPHRGSCRILKVVVKSG